jgi:hypothetical protein
MFMYIYYIILTIFFKYLRIGSLTGASYRLPPVLRELDDGEVRELPVGSRRLDRQHLLERVRR